MIFIKTSLIRVNGKGTSNVKYMLKLLGRWRSEKSGIIFIRDNTTTVQLMLV